ncbi:Ger(x)C family spore germination protein [Bacillus sp. Cr_A10]|uniref:Ger(x)C family spore germination protein n=1 Tax=Bacillus sp. Cr_A10 TaxID=3033993 RepID=UPI0023DB5DA9|nr:Ger(x)C family spore germination protein [Bacillus sp. Cr_A10]MDF2067669.1 Ger(x)C family spore germination protein [Bacillus sp. Cr_A10]
MKGKLKLLAITFCFIFLAGCTEKELKIPLEDVGMVGVLAFDYIDDEQTQITVAIPQYDPEAKEHTQIFSVSTDLISKGIVEIEALSDKKIVLNQLRVVLVNEQFALQGDVRNAIQQLYRNAEVGNKVLIAVVKESAEDMLKQEYPDKPSVIMYLNDLLQPSVNTAFNPNTNIHDFMYTQTNPNFDSIVPFLKTKDGKIDIDGIALFKEKSMLKSLSTNEGLIIQALQGRKKLAPLNIELNNENQKEKLLIDLIDSKIKIRSNKDLKAPKLNIVLKMSGTLIEYRGERENKLKSIDNIVDLEKDVNKKVEQDISNFLEEIKKLEVDPIGLTENFRMHYKGNWDKELTNETISKLEWDIQVDTSILSTGILR